MSHHHNDPGHPPRGRGLTRAGGGPSELTQDDFLLLFRDELEQKRRLAKQADRPLQEQVDQYLAWCARQPRSSEAWITEKRRVLELLIGEGARRLADFTADAIERHMQAVLDAGKSVKTANNRHGILRAFGTWCVKTGRLAKNPGCDVEAFEDCRQTWERRSLTRAEIAALFHVAMLFDPSGRRYAWYAAAYFAGLRRGDLINLRCNDVDFDAGTITIIDGKAKRRDVLPMRPELAEALKAIWPKADQAEHRDEDPEDEHGCVRAGFVVGAGARAHDRGDNAGEDRKKRDQLKKLPNLRRLLNSPHFAHCHGSSPPPWGRHQK